MGVCVLAGKAIAGYPDYEVFEDGRVYSHKTKRFLKPNVSSNGYASVELFNDDGSKRLSVHRLVAEAFIPNPHSYPCVNHKDENRLNNCASNLEWCTYRYNSNYGGCQEKIRKNRRTNTTGMLRFRAAAANSHNRMVVNLDTGEVFEKIIRASERFGVNASHISEACNGKRKTAGGFRWSYFEKDGDDLSACVY